MTSTQVSGAVSDERLITAAEACSVISQREPDTGHGHIFPRPDGSRMRCGGPGMCDQCAADKQLRDRALFTPIEQRDLLTELLKLRGATK